MPEALRPIVRQLAMNFCERWWIMMIRGIAAVVFGVLCFAMPALVLKTLVYLFAVYALFDGVLVASWAIFGRKAIEDWWILLLWGILGIAVGTMTFANPQITELVLVLYIAAWAIASGVLEMALAVSLRKEIDGEWLLALTGVLSIVTGVILMARPEQGALALVWLIGGYAIALGVLMLGLSLKFRSFGKRLADMNGATP
jgi:uncharacterized membrane protein HdeD (DUF308 family)